MRRTKLTVKYRIIIRRPHDVPSIKDLGSKESKEKLDGSENLWQSVRRQLASYGRTSNTNS